MFALCSLLVLWTAADAVLSLQKIRAERRAIDFARVLSRVRA